MLEPHCPCLLLRFVLNELVQTEKDYVKDLGIVVEVRGWQGGRICAHLIRSKLDPTWAQAL